jgi:hypothetical protein
VAWRGLQARGQARGIPLTARAGIAKDAADLVVGAHDGLSQRGKAVLKSRAFVATAISRA